MYCIKLQNIHIIRSITCNATDVRRKRLFIGDFSLFTQEQEVDLTKICLKKISR